MENQVEAGVQAAKAIYTRTLSKGASVVDAYIRGLDYIIDVTFKDHDMLEPTVLTAISKYEQAVGV